MRYEMRGEGTNPVVLIHEMGGTLETWDFMVDELAARWPIIRFDMRGCGLSEWQPGRVSADMLADDIAGLLEHLQIKGKVVVVGCAIGGAVAIHFAARHPQLTAGLVAMSPAVGVAEERKAATLKRADDLMVEGMRPTLNQRLANSYPQAMRDDPQRFTEIRNRRLSAGMHGMSELTRLVATLDMTDDYAKVTCPALIVAGLHDGDRPPAVVKPVADRIAGAHFEQLATGHFMPLQTPDLVLATITPFIGGCIA
jgi:3-oxoadipate enol-lactonase